MVVRNLDKDVFQGDFAGAQQVVGDRSFSIVSVARECFVGRDFHVPYPDGTWFKFWDLVSVYAFVMNEVKEGRKAFVHCCVGASRSVVVSVGWLCFRYGMDFETARNEAQRRLGVPVPSGPHLDSVRYLCNAFTSPPGKWYLRWLRLQLEADDAEPAPGVDPDQVFGWRVDVLKKYGARRVLVLGASAAELQYMSRHFDVTGITLAIRSYMRARSAGLNMVFTDVLDNDLPSNSFDAVVAFDVLEHTYNPWATIGEVWRLLKDGGVFFVSVPTSINKEAGTPWHTVVLDNVGWDLAMSWWGFKKQEDLSAEDIHDLGQAKVHLVNRVTAVYVKTNTPKFETYLRSYVMP